MNERAPLVIAGPSGSGKNYLVNELSKHYPVELVLSSTTRQPRKGERDQVDTDFLTQVQFDELNNRGDFFAVNHFFENRYAYRYSFFEAIWQRGCIPAVIYFTPLIEQIFATFPHGFGVYLMPDSLDILEARMRRRGDSEAEIVKRMASAGLEIAAYHEHANLFGYTCHIANDRDIDRAIAAIAGHFHLE